MLITPPPLSLPSPQGIASHFVWRLGLDKMVHAYAWHGMCQWVHLSPSRPDDLPAPCHDPVLDEFPLCAEFHGPGYLVKARDTLHYSKHRDLHTRRVRAELPKEALPCNPCSSGLEDNPGHTGYLWYPQAEIIRIENDCVSVDLSPARRLPPLRQLLSKLLHEPPVQIGQKRSVYLPIRAPRTLC
ncbi:hypothetical protein HY375_00685 [Candidatus Berkelbacteria bacterium]|nr:hypothetical protein [Candidatus Berkelbacteria bacterium]